MCKLKLYYLIILFIGFNTVYSQVNNHWQLGSSDIDFSNDPATINNIPGASGQYGLASISDTNGGLLFYTDGNKVWNKNHNTIGELSNFTTSSSRQKVIIVPHPSNGNIYYIFCSYWDVNSDAGNNNVWASYYYGIVDFSNNSLGELTDLISDNDTSPVGAAHWLYTDPLILDQNYVNVYRKPELTMLYDEQSNSYWVIARSKNNMLSFKIDSQGLNNNPVISTIQGLGDNATLSPTDNMFRFSPDNSKLAGLFYKEGNTPNYYGNVFYLMDFDINTGQFSNYQDIDVQSSSVTIFKDFEFSENSENIYFTRFKNHIYEPDPAIYQGEIWVKNLVNLSLPLRKLKYYGSQNFPSGFSSLQRDRFGNILVSSSSIGRIRDQNSYSNSSVEANYINTSSVFFPQLIYPLIECENNKTIVTEVLSGQTDNESVSNILIAKNIVNTTASVAYDAGESVILTPGFHAKNGSNFHAFIEGCNVTVSRTANSENYSFSDQILNNFTGEVKIYPNPANNSFTIETNKNLKGWSLYDSRGIQQKRSPSLKSKNLGLVDISNLEKGVYFIRINCEDGITISKQIIKL